MQAEKRKKLLDKILPILNRLIGGETLERLEGQNKEGTIEEFLEDWKWIFSFSGKYRWVIVMYTVLGIFSSSLSLGAAYISRILINIIVGKELSKLWVLVLAMLLSTAFSLVFGSVMSRILLKISIYVNNDIQARIYDQIIDARWEELSKYKNGDLLHRFNADVGTVSGNAIGWIPGLVINIYSFILTFIVMARMDIIMAGIAVLSAPVLLLLSRFIMRKMREYRKRVLELNSKMMSFEVETFYNFDTIKSFGIIDYYSRQLRDWQGRYKEYNLDYNKFEIKTKIMLTLVSTAVSMVAFFYCLYRLWTGQILYGDMNFFLQQRGALTSGFNSLVGTIPGMVNSAISAHRIRELVELPREKHDPEALAAMRTMAGQGITVEMNRVSFAYEEGREVYSDCSFTAKPGEIVAVLGTSGEGKTTLLRLLLGMLDPKEGSVQLRRADGEAFPINADLRQMFAYVPQGNTVFSGTIAENMRMVKEDATDEEIEAALRTACAWEFVEKLPEGIHSKLGDAGRGLSMGQGQRISIARALLRNCPILLLDEATSALDMETEKRVLENIIHREPNRTCIVSTHRTSVLEQCQRIYRIEGMKMTECTAEQLFGPEYAAI